jgi:hypothetical protein
MHGRLGEEAQQLRDFVNALREVLGLEPLYNVGYVREVERFHKMPYPDTGLPGVNY